MLRNFLRDWGIDVAYFLRDWGVEIFYIISGALGGLLTTMKKQNRKRSFWEYFIIIIVGLLTATFLTPLFVWIFDIPKQIHNSIAFILGYAGHNTIEYVIDFFRNKLDKK